ncbi:hypothetical protein PENTCL1PPCAC_5547, partial [Pristionchus entomophagus]
DYKLLLVRACAITANSSDTAEVKRRKRPSRNASKPLKYTKSSEDSDADSGQSVKKMRSESKKSSANERRPVKGDMRPATKESCPSKKNELQCPECEFHTRNVRGWVNHLRNIHSTTTALAGLALLCDCGHEPFRISIVGCAISPISL